MLSFLQYRAANVRVCNSRHSKRAGSVQGDAWLGQRGDAVGIRARPIGQWKSRRQMGRAGDDACRRGSFVRRKLDDQPCNGFCRAPAGMGLERLFSGHGVCARKPAAVELVGHKHRGFVYSFYVGMSGFSSVLAYFLPIIILGALGLDWRWIFRLSVFLMLFGAIV